MSDLSSLIQLMNHHKISHLHQTHYRSNLNFPKFNLKIKLISNLIFFIYFTKI